MEQAENTVSRKKFFVHLAGRTNGAHHEFVEKLKGIGKIQVFSFGGSNFLVVFCPIVTKVGMDIRVAMSSMPGGKPTILVVMHHTFDPERVVAPSRRQVDNPNVLLTVDCLFHDGSLLKCNLNDNAWLEVETLLGVSRPVVPFWKQNPEECQIEVNSHGESDFLVVSRPSVSKVGTDISVAMGSMPVSGKKFFVHLAGKTNGVHQEFVEILKGNGKIQVISPGESDFLVVFCPIVSRVGTDIRVAMSSMPGGKPTILVVMHHTFDPEHVVAPSRRQVNNPNVLLTVDCLFHEGRLLKCNLNDDEWLKVEKFLGVSRPVVPFWEQNPEKGQIQVISPGESDSLVVSCPSCSNVGSDISVAMSSMPVSGKKFFVHLAGKTNGVHQEFVEILKGNGKIQVISPGESDFLVVFCPIVSRVGTDIRVAMSSMPGGKPTILVVMHHTFDPEHVVAPSRRQVDNPNVLLTVDCLFHDGRLLKCNLNDNAWLEVKTFLGVSRPVVPFWKQISGKKIFVHLAGKTNGAHLELVQILKGNGQIQVISPGESDFLVVFCPIVSNVGTDISVAMSSMPGNKPTFLVVMHHTFDPEHVVAPSRRQVDNPNVLLTVDCLFHEGSLLKCNLNDRMWLEVEKFLGVSRAVIPLWNIFPTIRGVLSWAVRRIS